MSKGVITEDHIYAELGEIGARDVRDAGSALSIDETRLAADSRIAVGHIDGPGLVAAVDNSDAGVVEGHTKAHGRFP